MIQTLLSLPPAAARLGNSSLSSAAHVDSDPPGHQLGSGGGTAHLLFRAWRNLAPGASFDDWLSVDRKLIIHASGQSRRLPAYAAEGKARLPVPTMDSTGQTYDQTLVDLQVEAFTHILRHAPESYRLCVACGDTLIRYPHAMPVFPETDVLIIGIPSSPEEASAHGVLFTPVHEPGKIEFFLQKPDSKTIAKLATEYHFSLDSGVWLFSEHATKILLAKCGWDPETQSFKNGYPSPYELYNRFGTALGCHPSEPDEDLASLTAAVLPLNDARFYHFGTNRSVLSSMEQLRHPAEDRHAFGHASQIEENSGQIILHSNVSANLSDIHGLLWIENSTIPESWKLSGGHVLTGIPDNNWSLSLPSGVCIDSLPFSLRNTTDIAEADLPLLEALRIYGFDDAFKGSLDAPSTLWMGKPFTDWLTARGLSFDTARLANKTDLQDAALFPLIHWNDPAAERLASWMIHAPENPDAPDAIALRNAWLNASRVSATDLVQQAILAPRLERRCNAIRSQIANLSPEEWTNATRVLDLAATADAIRRDTKAVPPPRTESPTSSLSAVHDAIFRVELGDKTNSPDAYDLLSDLMVTEMALRPVSPTRNILEDQIVWSRAPARLDIAGGWSDTPPYCLEHGGRVLNIAVDLNGQPPIQTFVRICKEPKIILHSIDLGLSETIESYEDLTSTSALGPFSISRAALRLAGFDPRFSCRSYGSLEQQLKDGFGGGIELSTLAAIPKGSGLGTSSILAAAILGALNETCSLGWEMRDIFTRTSALEQLLTSGGGWQDQIGGVVSGAKLVSTRPGLSQTPDIRWLPDNMLSDMISSGRAMLYYTGVTRIARNILASIVRSIFLNNRHTLGCIGDIALNADFAAEAIQRANESALAEAVRRSWTLNRELDIGTLPSSLLPLTGILDRYEAAYKLLGAGGGGYMLILAPTIEAAAGIREKLRTNPLNSRARFVSISISKGLQITRS
ncbi:MAG: bifunctional fucokinase/fucose-1-phosphate guanylyltransferase [Kiritimatiellia bacterium]